MITFEHPQRRTFYLNQARSDGVRCLEASLIKIMRRVWRTSRALLVHTFIALQRGRATAVASDDLFFGISPGHRRRSFSWMWARLGPLSAEITSVVTG